MEILFQKVSTVPKYFELVIDEVAVTGNLKFIKDKIVRLDLDIGNSIVVNCSRCGSRMEYFQKESIVLHINDGIYSGDEFDDIIELDNGIINIDELIHLEFESIKLDYHLCSECEEKEDFEIEI